MGFVRGADWLAWPLGRAVHRETRIPLLFARVATSVCAFPIEHVIETMRPGAIEDGTSMHRGDRVPVIDAAAIIGERSAPSRCVVVRVGGGRAGVLVDEVLGVQRVESEKLVAMKALFTGSRLESVSDGLRAVLGTVRVIEVVSG